MYFYPVCQHGSFGESPGVCGQQLMPLKSFFSGIIVCCSAGITLIQMLMAVRGSGHSHTGDQVWPTPLALEEH